ncbi:barstar family protein [Streptomyces sp. NPDC001407]|uniref:barstar family protein n=1 Tax=Streptomyces sp. NPDC001407 TaxID=3364573 RepID=UPI0036801BBA
MVTSQGRWAAIKPWLHLVSHGACVPVNQLLPASGTNFVASMQGADALSVDDVFQKFWDAFKLPDYFGWNWSALRDCLRDLSWISSDHYLLVISDIEKMLPGDRESRLELFELLVDAGSRWAYVRHPEGGETGKLRIVLVCGEADFESLKSTFDHLLSS